MMVHENATILKTRLLRCPDHKFRREFIAIIEDVSSIRRNPNFKSLNSYRLIDNREDRVTALKCLRKPDGFIAPKIGIKVPYSNPVSFKTINEIDAVFACCRPAIGTQDFFGIQRCIKCCKQNILFDHSLT